MIELVLFKLFCVWFLFLVFLFKVFVKVFSEMILFFIEIVGEDILFVLLVFCLLFCNILLVFLFFKWLFVLEFFVVFCEEGCFSKLEMRLLIICLFGGFCVGGDVMGFLFDLKCFVIKFLYEILESIFGLEKLLLRFWLNLLLRKFWIRFCVWLKDDFLVFVEIMVGLIVVFMLFLFFGIKDFKLLLWIKFCRVENDNMLVCLVSLGGGGEI